MKGEEILNLVRYEIDDLGYTRYDDINRSYRDIARLCRWNWLRAESQDKLTFVDGVSSYWIDISDMRTMEALYVFGNDSGEKNWHLMTEATRKSFNTRRWENIKPDGTDNEDRPDSFVIKQSTGDSMEIQVTPVPDNTYTTKIDYVRNLEKIDRDTEPTMPYGYHDLIAYMAAGYILRRSRDPSERQRAEVLIGDARRNVVFGLLRDAHINRTANINRPKREWIK